MGRSVLLAIAVFGSAFSAFGSDSVYYSDIDIHLPIEALCVEDNYLRSIKPVQFDCKEIVSSEGTEDLVCHEGAANVYIYTPLEDLVESLDANKLKLCSEPFFEHEGEYIVIQGEASGGI